MANANPKTSAPNANSTTEGKAPVVQSTATERAAHALANATVNRADGARSLYDAVTDGADLDNDQIRAVRSLFGGDFANLCKLMIKLRKRNATISLNGDAADLL